MAKLDSQIRLSLDPEPAVSGLKKFADKWSGTMTGLNQGLEVISKVWGAVEGVASKFVEMSKLASAADAAQFALTASLRRVGEQYVGLVDSINIYNAAIQAATAIGDEDIIAIEAKLLALGVLPDQLEDATRATIGYAQATQKDAKGAAEQVAKAWREGESALKSMGVTLKEGETARGKLTEFYAVAEEKGRSLATRIGALNQVWGDLQETVGRNINAVVEETGVVGKLTTAVDDANVVLGQFGTSVGKAYEAGLEWTWAITRDTIPGLRLLAELTDAAADAAHDYANEVRDANKEQAELNASAAATSFKPTELYSVRDFSAQDAVDKDANKKVLSGSGTGDLRAVWKKREDAMDEALARMHDTQNAANERELRLQELHIERTQTRDEWAAEAKRKRQEREYNDEEAYYNKVWELKEKREKYEKEHTLQLGQYAMQVANFGLETAGAFLVGEAAVGDAAKAFFGSLAGIIGREMISMGVAAIGLSDLMATLGVPIVGAAAGAAAIAIGAGLVAAGGALRASAAKGAHAQASGIASPASYYTPPSGANAGFSNSTEPRSVVYNISFGAIVTGKTTAEIGRELLRYTRAAEAMGG